MGQTELPFLSGTNWRWCLQRTPKALCQIQLFPVSILEKLQLPSKQQRRWEAMETADIAASRDQKIERLLQLMYKCAAGQQNLFCLPFLLPLVKSDILLLSFWEIYLVMLHWMTTLQNFTHAMQLLCPRSILLNEGACLRLEFFLQSVEKNMLPEAALNPTEPLFFLTRWQSFRQPDYWSRHLGLGAGGKRDEPSALLQQDWVWRASWTPATDVKEGWVQSQCCRLHI